MKKLFLPFFILFLIAPILTAAEWPPIRSDRVNGRIIDRYTHGSLPEWGAKDPNQTDTFCVIHPDGDLVNAENRPLYVVLHSAGHALDSCIECMRIPGNHDIYDVPEDFYGLVVDCRANAKTDWWWGGRSIDEKEINDENRREKAGPDLSPAEKRVIATVKWTMEQYKIDPNRVYLSGNSMGGSGTLGIGLRHGDIFAAIKANVPAGCLHVADRMFFLEPEIPAGVTLPDPPVCVDYSANNDHYSNGHEILFRGMRERKYMLLAFWGPFNHENNHAKIEKVNDLFNRFDWLSIRKDQAYPAFTDASTDSVIPWPDPVEECPKSAPAGQVNAYFRWENVQDTPETMEMILRLATKDEIHSKIFDVPTASTANVSFRRLQQFSAAPGEEIAWTFGDLNGTVKADDKGLITIPSLTVTDQPTTIVLKKK